MSLKTKGMRKILEPIEVQINKLWKLLSSDSPKPPDVVLVKTVLSEHLQTVAEKFKDLSKEEIGEYREMKTKITNIIDQFCSMNNIGELNDGVKRQDSQTIATTLLSEFISCLETLEKLECLPLKQSLQDSWDYVKDMGAVKEIEDFQNIKELGASVVEVFGPLQRYRKSLVSQTLSEKIALYSCQICTTLNMLVQLVREQHQLHAPIYSCKKYVCDRMCWCFKMLVETLDTPNPLPEEEHSEKENHFVYRMDLVLDIIAGMPNKSQEEQIKECANLWLGIEDVFSHAMAIAQVCHPYNFNAITGVSQSIMAEFENLKTQLHAEKHDPTMNNLFMNTLSDAFYRLERKVNVSVLTLVMEVFSDPFSALRKLVMACGNSLNARDRSKNDLSNVIEEFDQVTDKAMQIGMFAIACCKDTNRVNKIRTCLASLESLESELVPATTAFYLHPDNKELRATVKLLTAQWQLEVNKLHNAVDIIIDSAAYCQVILDDMQQLISAMSDCLDNREGVTQTQVQLVVQRALSLSSQVSATVEDIGRETIDRQTTMMIRELKAAIYEAGMASKTLLVENATEPQQLRVIKRCELILNVVKRLQPALVTLINNSTSMHTSYGKASMGQGDTLHASITSSNSGLSFPGNIYGLPRDEKTFTYIRTPYTVKSYKPPLSLQPANSAPRTPANLSCLIPYIKRGRTMRTERSIMYKTPKANGDLDKSSSKNELPTRNLSSVRQHLFSRDSFVFKQEIDLSSESLDLTGILEKVTCLSDTLSSTLSNSITTKAPDVSQATKSDTKISPDITRDFSDKITIAAVGCVASFNGNVTTERADECSTIGGGDAPSAIETPERIGDLQRLEKKIEVLQKQMSKE